MRVFFESHSKLTTITQDNAPHSYIKNSNRIVKTIREYRINKINKKLDLSFYHQDTKSVAKQLIGKHLVRIYWGQKISGIITETEAYLGITDRACHTFEGRRTNRTEAMYLDGGHAYVYFIYGMYFCFNVVTRSPEEPEAVLIRSLQPMEGIDLMSKFRKIKDQKSKDQKSNLKKNNLKKNEHLTNGPGKLSQALKIDKSLNGELLTGEKIFIEEGLEIDESKIISTPRIGVAYAKEAANWPLRFYLPTMELLETS